MLKPCLTCGRPTPNGNRCTTHAKHNGYMTQHWQTTRQQRLNLDNHRCQLRHNGCTERATTVHLDPALNGDHTQATLAATQSACRHCHGIEDAPRSNGYAATSTRATRVGAGVGIENAERHAQQPAILAGILTVQENRDGKSDARGA